jgi:hypothetical protein
MSEAPASTWITRIEQKRGIMDIEFSGFDAVFTYLTDDVKMEPVDAAYALASANATNKDHGATWFESPGYRIRALKRLNSTGPESAYKLTL